MIKRLLLSIFMVLAMVGTSLAATQQLSWTVSNIPDLAGYKVSYGTSTGVYSQTIDVGDVTQYTLTGLDDDTTYYYIIIAYDIDSNESLHVAEDSFTTPPGTPTPVDVNADIVSHTFLYDFNKDELTIGIDDSLDTFLTADPDEVIPMEVTIIFEGKGTDGGDLILHGTFNVTANSKGDKLQ